MPIVEQKKVYRSRAGCEQWWEVVLLDHSNGCCGPWYKLIARDEKGRELVRMDNPSLEIIRKEFQDLVEDLHSSTSLR